MHLCCMKTLAKVLVLALMADAALPSIVAGETIYFLVGDPRATDWVLVNDSYVLPLSRQEDIDHARFLLALGRSVFVGSNRALVIAKVGPGNDAINRDYVNPHFPEWSWHVVELRGFYDFSSDELDGTATDVENQPGWYLGTDSRDALIAFCRYTIVRELGPYPLFLSIMPEGQNLQFYWSGLGTNSVYSLEGNESVASTNWYDLPDASWPLKTNHWTLAQTNASARFYRVTAKVSNQ